MSELKPCPCCGAVCTMLVVEGHSHKLATFMPDHNGSAYIECTGTDCNYAMAGETVEEVVRRHNRRAEQNEALTVVMPLTNVELIKRDGKPVWRYHVDKGIGGWDIFTLDDKGNWCFVCTYLAQGAAMNNAVVQRVKQGRELLFDREVAPDMMEKYNKK